MSRNPLYKFSNELESFTLFAARAPREGAARALADLPGVAEVGGEEPVLPLSACPQIPLEIRGGARTGYLVQPHKSEWSICFRTLHWAEASDADAVLSAAAALSHALGVQTLAMPDRALHLWPDGPKRGLTDWDKLGQKAAELAFSPPPAFIFPEGPHAGLYLDDDALSAPLTTLRILFC